MSCLSLLPFQSPLRRHSVAAAPRNRVFSLRCRLPLHESDEDDDGAELAMACPTHFHVLGLGQAMVDFSGMVEESFVERLGVGVEKGGRKEVNHEERGRVLRAMDGRSYKAAAGGSLSNTLVALARLAPPPSGLAVGMAATIGPDPLGAFFRSKLGRARVHLVSEAVPEATTGTVIVLTTPDAQRTMLSFQGTSPPLRFEPSLAALVSRARVLVLEGYLFALPGALHTIKQACRTSTSTSLVALTASDVSCVRAHFNHFWDVLSNYADMLFANSDEARALCGFRSDESAEVAARYLSHSVGLVSVTDGAKGSYIGIKGEAVYIPPWPCAAVDTCGAGDAYAAGILYAILRGREKDVDIAQMGMLASRVAATVVAQQGTRLSVQHAATLAHSYQPDHISSF